MPEAKAQCHLVFPRSDSGVTKQGGLSRSHLLRAWLKWPLSRARSKRLLRFIGLFIKDSLAKLGKLSDIGPRPPARYLNGSACTPLHPAFRTVLMSDAWTRAAVVAAAGAIPPESPSDAWPDRFREWLVEMDLAAGI